MFRLSNSVDKIGDVDLKLIEKNFKQNEDEIRYQKELLDFKQKQAQDRIEKEEAIKRQGAEYTRQQQNYAIGVRQRQQDFINKQQTQQRQQISHQDQTSQIKRQQDFIQKQKELAQKAISQPKKKEVVKQKSHKTLKSSSVSSSSSSNTNTRMDRIINAYSKDTRKKVLALNEKDFYRLMKKKLEEEINKEIALGLKNTKKKDIRQILDLAKEYSIKEEKSKVKHKQKLFLAGIIPIILGLAATGILPTKYTVLAEKK